MHELGIAQEVVALVAEHAQGKVTRVVLEIGKLSAILPDAVRFCFDLCSEGTVVAGAQLEIIEIPGLGPLPRLRWRSRARTAVRPLRMRRHRPRMVGRRGTESQRIRGIRCVKPVAAPTNSKPKLINLQSGLTLAIGTANDHEHVPLDTSTLTPHTITIIDHHDHHHHDHDHGHSHGHAEADALIRTRGDRPSGNGRPRQEQPPGGAQPRLVRRPQYLRPELMSAPGQARRPCWNARSPTCEAS